MRRRRFSPGQRLAMWWVYTLLCMALYFGIFAAFNFSGEGFLIAFIVTFLVVGAVGLVVKWVASL